MAVGPRYIADKSALARLTDDRVNAVLEPLIMVGLVATCGMIDLEVLFSARNHTDFVRTRRLRTAAFPLVPMRQADFDRAIVVMETLARQGQHRSVSLPDLLIAAAAERADLCVLHYDADFDRIAAVTGQRTLWVVPRASVP